ncbi:MAG: hypothetical protein ACREK4_24320 [Candidatus Rokuibacteriota bacterium]
MSRSGARRVLGADELAAAQRRKRKPTIISTRADKVRAGDVLWSDASMEGWRVVAAVPELVRTDGNLVGVDAEDPSVPRTVGYVFSVVDELTGRRSQRLGAFAPHALVMVARHVPSGRGAGAVPRG